MRKLLAVGAVALGTFGLIGIRGTKTAVAALQGTARELAPLQLIQKIPVPGVAGRIDHFTAPSRVLAQSRPLRPPSTNNSVPVT